MCSLICEVSKRSWALEVRVEASEVIKMHFCGCIYGSYTYTYTVRKCKNYLCWFTVIQVPCFFISEKSKGKLWHSCHTIVWFPMSLMPQVSRIPDEWGMLMHAIYSWVSGQHQGRIKAIILLGGSDKPWALSSTSWFLYWHISTFILKKDSVWMLEYHNICLARITK